MDELCHLCRDINIELLYADQGYAFYPTWGEVEESGKSCRFCKFLTTFSIFLTKDGILHMIEPKNNNMFAHNVRSFFDRMGYNTTAEYQRVLKAEVTSTLQTLLPGRLYALNLPSLGGVGLLLCTEEKIPYFRLTIGEEPNERSQELNLVTRNQLSSTASDSTFENIQRWFSDCDEEHPCCPGNVEVFPPVLACPAARLLDVCAFDGSLDLKLVEVTEELDTSKYITLSHRWGKEDMYTSSRDTQESRRQRIPYADLPRTFQDAVQATRKLGYRYLWIDSICIIQGDAKDWAAEAGKMRDIYSQCTLMIAADSSSGCNSGLFNAKSTLQDEEPLGAHEVLRSTSANGDTNTLYVSNEKQSIVVQCLEYGELSSRGWTFQECTLAPRIIHYHQTQVIWECKFGFETEDPFGIRFKHLDQPSKPLYTPPTMTSMFLASPSGVFSDDMILRRWYSEVVNKFSLRALTIPEDKLPAIAGLAAIAANSLKCDYVAGMWRKELEWALTWYRFRITHDFGANDSLLAKDHACPSFSWASTSGKVFWPANAELFRPTLQIENIFLQPKDESNPFGGLERGELTISCFVLRLTIGGRSLSGSEIKSFEAKNNVFFDHAWYIEEEKEYTCVEVGSADEDPEKEATYLLVLDDYSDTTEPASRLGLCEILWKKEGDERARQAYADLRKWTRLCMV